MYNKVILMGTLNCPIATKQINPNLQMGTLQLTVERTYPKQGVPFLEISIIDCDLWGKQIEEASKFAPGSMIIVEGRLRCVRKPNLKTGGEFVALSMVVEKMFEVNGEVMAETVANKNKREDFERANSVDYVNSPRAQQRVPDGIDIPEDLPF